MMRRLARLTAAASLVLLAACRGEPSGPSTPDDAARSASLSLTDAIDGALAHAGAGVPVEAELELGDGRSVYEVELLIDGSIRELVLDANTGRVLDELDEQDAETESAVAAALPDAAVSLGDAIELAERATGARAFEAEVAEDRVIVLLTGESGGVEVELALADGSILAQRPTDARPDSDDEDADDDDR